MYMHPIIDRRRFPSKPFGGLGRTTQPDRHRNKNRQGSVELEAVLITGLMFPLAAALYYLALRGFALLYTMIAGVLEWPYL
jgi:hypothetical protein